MECTSVNTGSYIAGGVGYPSTEGAFRNSSCRGGTLNRADANGFYVDYADFAYNYHWQAIGY